MPNNKKKITEITFEQFKKEVLHDYLIACESREMSILGRKEVLTGKAKFGIFGDGKEIAQIALAKQYQYGDWRAGYYRDQTMMIATGNLKHTAFFAQLYANTDINEEPTSAGRQMNGHFGTRSLDESGNWKDLMQIKNSSADISPTAGQMLRALGLAFASKLFRHNDSLHNYTTLSDKGNEICFATIGDASTSEGYFWEAINAAGVMQIPLIVSVWDDGYGISVPKKYQTTKQSISDATAGFASNDDHIGIDIYKVKAWDYPSLVETYQISATRCRELHKPVLVHVEECTQPLGHSTSGSHERYKSAERLQWEKDFDGLKKMKEWLLANAIATIEELDDIANTAKQTILDAKRHAWNAYQDVIEHERHKATLLLHEYEKQAPVLSGQIQAITNKLNNSIDHFHKDIVEALRHTLRISIHHNNDMRMNIKAYLRELNKINHDRYNSELYAENEKSALKVTVHNAVYSDASPLINGYEILNIAFDKILERDQRVVAFGEDVGKIGDVNQGFNGLQEKHGKLRVFDTGIREATIMGQALGLAMRGLRPIAEIQYLDYLLYGLQILSDDVATLRYRTKSGQSAPLIIRTRGHRLEGIWHTGSPMGMIINSIRGMYLCVPRNMTQAVGMYNTMLQSDDPAIIIECLNGYRLKERLPDNLEHFTVPLGIPEILQEGTDVTLVTYGSCCRIAQAAIPILFELNISVELIDVQTLLPFDIHHIIAKSVKKTNRIIFMDEDFEGGASAFMMQQAIQGQKLFSYLDVAPVTLFAKPHRSPYGSDGDYFSKPSTDDVIESVYLLMQQAEPGYYNEM